MKPVGHPRHRKPPEPVLTHKSRLKQVPSTLQGQSISLAQPRQAPEPSPIEYVPDSQGLQRSLDVEL